MFNSGFVPARVSVECLSNEKKSVQNSSIYAYDGALVAAGGSMEA